MSEWQKLTLSQITEPVKNTYLPKGDEQLAYIGLEHIEQETLRLTGVGTSSDVTSNKFKFEANDVLFGKLRPYFRKVYKPKFSGICSTDIWVFRAKNGFIQDYLFYFLACWDFVDTANSGEGGTRMPRADWNFLKTTSWLVPCGKEQKAIASILSSLDDKIDLLHRQNTTIERMAETLFRQWFVEEAQDDWEFVVLGKYIECFNGVSYKSSELNPSKVAMVTLKSFDRNGGFRLDGFKEFTGKFKEQHIVTQGDLVVAHTDITQDAEVIGNPVLVVNNARYELMVISMDLVKVKSKHEWLSNEFLYRMMRTREFKEHCLGYSNGSTVLHLSKQAIPAFEFSMPPKEKIESYTKLTKDLFNKKFKNIEQIQTLEKLRDTLLPKLMSGEVRVTI
ncbi:restriction endonuclease subunit S [Methylotenera sp. G11]|uniref:restriction endonuclease subunit S n=1 Tax=Methylotenera sp. G11 TaxID=1506585 RepID=UPI0009DE5862|nr:restriction endonuclease subunit S [Methylotenera sp. G11]